MPDSAELKTGPAEVNPGVTRIMTEAELRTLEADNIRAALKATGGKVYGPDGAAVLLGVKPTTLASRMKGARFGSYSQRRFSVSEFLGQRVSVCKLAGSPG